ncbi:MAG: bifunctional DNA-formamidopyrimidine glycosylase/DNA-(apurinic or apyrimidinic site) lyase [Deltaproteobacteria bacterium]|nr:bifunctional DNA-formamidopyrimidine glycosylase/DNA-(apurinic or apyrimidinic site) lyase [Deltaproteobacteria bacterium]
MPELPEIETVRRSLLPRLVGRRIEAAVVRERRLRRPIPPDFAARVVGQRIEAISRRAKYLLFHLSRGDCMLAHLGMSGALLVRATGKAPQCHDHVCMRLTGRIELVLNDPRRFGLLAVARAEAVAELPELQRLGPDPLDPGLSTAALYASIHRSRRALKNLLLDQAVLAGVGNIYASEALFRAGIRPTRRGNRVRLAEVAPLLQAIRAVLAEAIAAGGSSISDYRDGNGRPGSFQLRFCAYDRAGQPCRKCGAVIRRVVQTGRSSFYCPACQR